MDQGLCDAVDRAGQFAALDVSAGQYGGRAIVFRKVERLAGLEQTGFEQRPEGNPFLLAGILADERFGWGGFHRVDTRLRHPDVLLVALDADPAPTELFRHCAGRPGAEEFILAAVIFRLFSQCFFSQFFSKFVYDDKVTFFILVIPMFPSIAGSLLNSAANFMD